MRLSCALMVSCFSHPGRLHSFTKPLQAALASCCPLGENAHAAIGRSSPISLLCRWGSSRHKQHVSVSAPEYSASHCSTADNLCSSHHSHCPVKLAQHLFAHLTDNVLSMIVIRAFSFRQAAPRCRCQKFVNAVALAWLSTVLAVSAASLRSAASSSSGLSRLRLALLMRSIARSSDQCPICTSPPPADVGQPPCQYGTRQKAGTNNRCVPTQHLCTQQKLRERVSPSGRFHGSV